MPRNIPDSVRTLLQAWRTRSVRLVRLIDIKLVREDLSTWLRVADDDIMVEREGGVQHYLPYLATISNLAVFSGSRASNVQVTLQNVDRSWSRLFVTGLVPDSEATVYYYFPEVGPADGLIEMFTGRIAEPTVNIQQVQFVIRSFVDPNMLSVPKRRLEVLCTWTFDDVPVDPDTGDVIMATSADVSPTSSVAIEEIGLPMGGRFDPQTGEPVVFLNGVYPVTDIVSCPYARYGLTADTDGSGQLLPEVTSSDDALAPDRRIRIADFIRAHKGDGCRIVYDRDAGEIRAELPGGHLCGNPSAQAKRKIFTSCPKTIQACKERFGDDIERTENVNELVHNWTQWYGGFPTLTIPPGAIAGRTDFNFNFDGPDRIF